MCWKSEQMTAIHTIHRSSKRNVSISRKNQKRTQAQHTYKQANLALVGLPPMDLIDALADALRAAAFDVDEVFQRAVSCSNEFLHPVEQSTRERAGALCTFHICSGCRESHVI